MSADTAVRVTPATDNTQPKLLSSTSRPTCFTNLKSIENIDKFDRLSLNTTVVKEVCSSITSTLPFDRMRHRRDNFMGSRCKPRPDNRHDNYRSSHVQDLSRNNHDRHIDMGRNVSRSDRYTQNFEQTNTNTTSPVCRMEEPSRMNSKLKDGNKKQTECEKRHFILNTDKEQRISDTNEHVPKEIHIFNNPSYFNQKISENLRRPGTLLKQCSPARNHPDQERYQPTREMLNDNRNLPSNVCGNRDVQRHYENKNKARYDHLPVTINQTKNYENNVEKARNVENSFPNRLQFINDRDSDSSNVQSRYINFNDKLPNDSVVHNRNTNINQTVEISRLHHDDRKISITRNSSLLSDKKFDNLGRERGMPGFDNQRDYQYDDPYNNHHRNHTLTQESVNWNEVCARESPHNSQTGLSTAGQALKEYPRNFNPFPSTISQPKQSFGNDEAEVKQTEYYHTHDNQKIYKDKLSTSATWPHPYQENNEHAVPRVDQQLQGYPRDNNPNHIGPHNHQIHTSGQQVRKPAITTINRPLPKLQNEPFKGHKTLPNKPVGIETISHPVKSKMPDNLTNRSAEGSVCPPPTPACVGDIPLPLYPGLKLPPPPPPPTTQNTDAKHLDNVKERKAISESVVEITDCMSTGNNRSNEADPKQLNNNNTIPRKQDRNVKTEPDEVVRGQSYQDKFPWQTVAPRNLYTYRPIIAYEEPKNVHKSEEHLHDQRHMYRNRTDNRYPEPGSIFENEMRSGQVITVQNSNQTYKQSKDNYVNTGQAGTRDMIDKKHYEIDKNNFINNLLNSNKYDADRNVNTIDERWHFQNNNNQHFEQRFEVNDRYNMNMSRPNEQYERRVNFETPKQGQPTQAPWKPFEKPRQHFDGPNQRLRLPDIREVQYRQSESRINRPWENRRMHEITSERANIGAWHGHRVPFERRSQFLDEKGDNFPPRRRLSGLGIGTYTENHKTRNTNHSTSMRKNSSLGLFRPWDKDSKPLNNHKTVDLYTRKSENTPLQMEKNIWKNEKGLNTNEHSKKVVKSGYSKFAAKPSSVLQKAKEFLTSEKQCNNPTIVKCVTRSSDTSMANRNSLYSSPNSRIVESVTTSGKIKDTKSNTEMQQSVAPSNKKKVFQRKSLVEEILSRNHKDARHTREELTTYSSRPKNLLQTKIHNVKPKKDLTKINRNVLNDIDKETCNVKRNDRKDTEVACSFSKNDATMKDANNDNNNNLLMNEQGKSLIKKDLDKFKMAKKMKTSAPLSSITKPNVNTELSSLSNVVLPNDNTSMSPTRLKKLNRAILKDRIKSLSRETDLLKYTTHKHKSAEDIETYAIGILKNSKLKNTGKASQQHLNDLVRTNKELVKRGNTIVSESSTKKTDNLMDSSSTQKVKKSKEHRSLRKKTKKHDVKILDSKIKHFYSNKVTGPSPESNSHQQAKTSRKDDKGTKDSRRTKQKNEQSDTKNYSTRSATRREKITTMTHLKSPKKQISKSKASPKTKSPPKSSVSRKSSPKLETPTYLNQHSEIAVGNVGEETIEDTSSQTFYSAKKHILYRALKDIDSAKEKLDNVEKKVHATVGSVSRGKYEMLTPTTFQLKSRSKQKKGQSQKSLNNEPEEKEDIKLAKACYAAKKQILYRALAINALTRDKDKPLSEAKKLATKRKSSITRDMVENELHELQETLECSDNDVDDSKKIKLKNVVGKPENNDHSRVIAAVVKQPSEHPPERCLKLDKPMTNYQPVRTHLGSYAVQCLHGPIVSSTFYKPVDTNSSRVIRNAKEELIGYATNKKNDVNENSETDNANSVEKTALFGIDKRLAFKGEQEQVNIDLNEETDGDIQDVETTGTFNTDGHRPYEGDRDDGLDLRVVTNKIVHTSPFIDVVSLSPRDIEDNIDNPSQNESEAVWDNELNVSKSSHSDDWNEGENTEYCRNSDESNRNMESDQEQNNDEILRKENDLMHMEGNNCMQENTHVVDMEQDNTAETEYLNYDGAGNENYDISQCSEPEFLACKVERDVLYQKPSASSQLPSIDAFDVGAPDFRSYSPPVNQYMYKDTDFTPVNSKGPVNFYPYAHNLGSNSRCFFSPVYSSNNMLFEDEKQSNLMKPGLYSPTQEDFENYKMSLVKRNMEYQEEDMEIENEQPINFTESEEVIWHKPSAYTRDYDIKSSLVLPTVPSGLGLSFDCQTTQYTPNYGSSNAGHYTLGVDNSTLEDSQVLGNPKAMSFEDDNLASATTKSLDAIDSIDLIDPVIPGESRNLFEDMIESVMKDMSPGWNENPPNITSDFSISEVLKTEGRSNNEHNLMLSEESPPPPHLSPVADLVSFTDRESKPTTAGIEASENSGINTEVYRTERRPMRGRSLRQQRYQKHFPVPISRAKPARTFNVEKELYTAAERFLKDFDYSHKRSCREKKKEVPDDTSSASKQKATSGKSPSLSSPSPAKTKPSSVVTPPLQIKLRERSTSTPKLEKLPIKSTKTPKIEVKDHNKSKKGAKSEKGHRGAFTDNGKNKMKSNKMKSQLMSAKRSIKIAQLKGKSSVLKKELEIKRKDLSIEQNDTKMKLPILRIKNFKSKNRKYNFQILKQKKSSKLEEKVKKGQEVKMMKLELKNIANSSESQKSSPMRTSTSDMVIKKVQPLATIKHEGMFKCLMCKVTFPKVIELKEHYNTKHGCWCIRCNKQFRNLEARRIHVIRNHDVEICCTLCNTTFFQKSNYHRHLRSAYHLEKVAIKNNEQTAGKQPSRSSVISIDSEEDSGLYDNERDDNVTETVVISSCDDTSQDESEAGRSDSSSMSSANKVSSYTSYTEEDIANKRVRYCKPCNGYYRKITSHVKTNKHFLAVEESEKKENNSLVGQVGNGDNLNTSQDTDNTFDRTDVRWEWDNQLGNASAIGVGRCEGQQSNSTNDDSTGCSELISDENLINNLDFLSERSKICSPVMLVKNISEFMPKTSREFEQGNINISMQVSLKNTGVHTYEIFEASEEEFLSDENVKTEDGVYYSNNNNMESVKNEIEDGICILRNLEPADNEVPVMGPPKAILPYQNWSFDTISTSDYTEMSLDENSDLDFTEHVMVTDKVKVVLDENDNIL